MQIILSKLMFICSHQLNSIYKKNIQLFYVGIWTPFLPRKSEVPSDIYNVNWKFKENGINKLILSDEATKFNNKIPSNTLSEYLYGGSFEDLAPLLGILEKSNIIHYT